MRGTKHTCRRSLPDAAPPLLEAASSYDHHGISSCVSSFSVTGATGCASAGAPCVAAGALALPEFGSAAVVGGGQHICRTVGTERHPALDQKVWPLTVRLIPVGEVGVTRLDDGIDIVAVAIPANPFDLINKFSHRDCRSDRRYRRCPGVAVEVLVDQVQTMLPAPGSDLFAERHTPFALRTVGIELLEVWKPFTRC